MGCVTDSVDSFAILGQFNRLMKELLGQGVYRHTFRPWEIEILIEIEEWNVLGSRRAAMLRRYQKAVQRHLESGARMPLRFSEFLQSAGSKPRS
jgi:hypothetical protein